MKIVRRILAFALTAFTLDGCTPASVLPTLPVETATTVVVPAAPGLGFHYPYLLRLPGGFAAGGKTFLLVEPNNSGHASDDFDSHLAAARSLAENAVGADVSRRLRIPLLVPVFPRSEDLYTHSLNRPTLEATAPRLRRIDLQLLAMVEDARRRLAERAVLTHEKFLMTGFSASGAFVNRFAALHPEKLQAVATGGVNGMLVLPLAKLDSTPLPFPIGIHDFDSLAGKPFQGGQWRRLPQFIYMGAEDTNDAVQFDDAYSEAERSLIYRLLGERMQPERWERCQALYRMEAANAEFRTYKGIGHGTNGRINSEISDFFRRSMTAGQS